jgi:hypothetical protein
MLAPQRAIFMVLHLNMMAPPANSGTLVFYRVPPLQTTIITTVHPRPILLGPHHPIDPRRHLTVRQLAPTSFLLTALLQTTTVLPKDHFTPAVPTNAAILDTMTRDTTVVRAIVMRARLGIRFVPTVAAMGGAYSRHSISGSVRDVGGESVQPSYGHEGHSRDSHNNYSRGSHNNSRWSDPHSQRNNSY